ncbi:DEAD/DEAH box helicase [Rheinheimera marina]|uniref:DEAD/DEAH box helicase n=1 Tax=Rheinheimera marina TaxID=1774958 RepID=A0ABV9JHC3_9GAMM
MSLKPKGSGAAGIHETTGNIADSLRQYIEAQYHIRNEGLIRERNALLKKDATIAQTPYVESTPVYKAGEPYDRLPIPKVASEALTQLSQLGVGLYPTPYEHQSQALASFLAENGADLVIATGTGSGKTESFLMPIIGKLVIEGAERTESSKLPGCRAMLLYPMNALVNDQLSRVRRLFGNSDATKIISKGRGKPIRFGSYTGRTPYPGSRESSKDEKFIKPLFEEFYSRVAQDPGLKKQLERIGRWPSKDLDAFYGSDLVQAKTNKSGKDYVSKKWRERLKTQPTDRELMTRHEMQLECPELIITNYSMLEYMLMRPIERGIFQQTKEWLKADSKNEFILVLDEAHMYRGAGGAEVALLIRRLCARLEIPRERMRCILTSASLGKGDEAIQNGERFARDLTGLSESSSRRIEVIQGVNEFRDKARPASLEETDVLASFELDSIENSVSDPKELRKCLANLATQLGWLPPPDGAPELIQDWLFKCMTGFGPLEELIAKVSGHAIKLDKLSETIFPNCSSQAATHALDTLMALGCHARRKSDGRVLIPTRLHLFYRGLPGLHACIDPECSERLDGQNTSNILGRLYTKPMNSCSCKNQGRVYELLTHRDCGAAFIRGYVSSKLDFVWHKPSGPISRGDTVDLMPIDILVEDSVHPQGRYRDYWMHISTGRLSALIPANTSGYRKVRIPDKVATESEISFDDCPVCMRKASKGEQSKIMDHITKGEAPFTALVRTQMARQQESRPVDVRYPNGGRKVLVFSDGRQKAARLARDIPRDIELDLFRQAIALACTRLEALSKEAKPTPQMYLSFLSVLTEHDLPIFDGLDATIVTNARTEFERDYSSDLTEAFEDDFSPTGIPARYKISLLKLLCSNYYSLTGTTIGFVEPVKTKLKKLNAEFLKAGMQFDENDIKALSIAWIEGLLSEFAIDPSIDATVRIKAAGYFRPGWGTKGTFSYAFRSMFTRQIKGGVTSVEKIEEIFCNELAQEHNKMWYLSPNSLKLKIDLSHIWAQCPDCTVLMPMAYQGSICIACGSKGVKWLDPKSSDYISARKGFWRGPVHDALSPGSRLLNLSVEEHTAQLSNRDRSSVHATTELYELRFQDVLIEDTDRPIDILSCTTTMEVGVDIGSLVAVALRNVPPQRENYQQRAGRAGRRGSSISTVVTYSQNGPHDSYYFLNPEYIVAGEPRTPEVKVSNAKIARRHVHAYLIQTFFHEMMEQSGNSIGGKKTSILEKSLGLTREFFKCTGEDNLNYEGFKLWVERRLLAPEGDLRGSIAAWLPPYLDTNGFTLEEWLVRTVEDFLKDLLLYNQNMSQQIISDENSEEEQNIRPKLEQEEFLEFLFYYGLLPSYAFPTNLSSFLVEKHQKNSSGSWEIRTIQRPQQAVSKALSEYAPGRLIVIDKKTYRSGGVFADLPASEVNRARPLFEKEKKVIHCEACSFMRDPNSAKIASDVCPVCKGELKEEIMIVPEVFGPERARELDEDDREQEITFATMAQFPQPVDQESFTFNECGSNVSFTYATDQRLVTINWGKNKDQDSGFLVCTECGSASVFEQFNQSHVPHERPYKHLGAKDIPKQCSGELKRVLLGHDFVTDLLLLRLEIKAPLITDTTDPIALRVIEDSLHTIVEALRLSASRHKQLDLDPSEFGAGFRIIPALKGETRLVDLFLYDTLSGGAGYAEIAAKNLPEILKGTLSILEDCSCDASCTECINHYHNQHIQSRFDRKLGAALLRYAIFGEAPVCSSPEAQAKDLSQLCSSLELDRFRCTEGHSPETPIFVDLNSQRMALGCYPALIGREDFDHAVINATNVNHKLWLSEYELRANLMDAHQRVRNIFG